MLNTWLLEKQQTIHMNKTACDTSDDIFEVHKLGHMNLEESSQKAEAKPNFSSLFQFYNIFSPDNCSL